MGRKLIVFPTAGGFTFAWLYGLLFYAPNARKVLFAELGRIYRHEASPPGQDPEIRRVLVEVITWWNRRKQKALRHGRRL